MGAGKYTTQQLINAMVQMKDEVRMYIICNAYEMNNELNCDIEKVKWYIKIGYELLDGNMSILSEEEKDEFVKLHFQYLEILKSKYKTFEELPIHGMLGRFELLSNLQLN